VDILAVAALDRSISNIKGFCCLVLENNSLLANSIVRLQLDTLTRFSSIYLVSEPHDLAHNILKGVELKKLKDRSNKEMTDRYLCEQLNLKENIDWMYKIYKDGCGFVHLRACHQLRDSQAA
jgi:hypothetical protein